MARERRSYRGGNRAPRRRRSRFGTAVVLCLTFTALLLVFSLLGRTELTAVNDELYAETAKVRALEEEQDKLQIAYSGTVDLTAVEQYAVDELGMTRSLPEQSAETEDQAPDKVTVLTTEGAAAVAEWTETWAERLTEYFP